MRSYTADRRGVSVVEILVSLGFLVVIATAVSTMIANAARSESATALRERAVGFARETVEIVTAVQNEVFSCTCLSPNVCTATECTRAIDGQSCSLNPEYATCWTPYPVGLSTADPLHAEYVGGAWVLLAGAEQIAADPIFTRSIALTDVDGDTNRKQVTVTVAWNDRGHDRSVELATILTAWKELVP